MVSGEASLGTVLSADTDADLHVLARYLPELSGSTPVAGSLILDFAAAASLWTSRTSLAEGASVSDRGGEPYRAWVRLSTPRWELRAGLQKIAFGSAGVFRPLMWFDRVDPRDPLQLSDGVWGVLGKLYLPGNASLWGWAVRGDDEVKGWEVIPTEVGSTEAGGRIELLVGPGELAASYHHRRFDLDALGSPTPGATLGAGEEDRVAVDGRWDVEVGLWVEAAFVRQASEAVQDPWTRAVSVGADYTFDVGNGLTVLTEHLDKETPSLAGPWAPGEPGTPADSTRGETAAPEASWSLTSFTANYPLGVLDRVSAAVYHDWRQGSWFRLVEWRRTYDRWRLHLLGFWNPEDLALLPSSGPGDPGESGLLRGRGAQIIVVFNH
jgi:hypothetical protein